MQGILFYSFFLSIVGLCFDRFHCPKCSHSWTSAKAMVVSIIPTRINVLVEFHWDSSGKNVKDVLVLGITLLILTLITIQFDKFWNGFTKESVRIVMKNHDHHDRKKMTRRRITSKVHMKRIYVKLVEWVVAIKHRS